MPDHDVKQARGAHRGDAQSPVTSRVCPRFEVLDSFFLESRGWYVLSGRIVEGIFQKGQVGCFEHHKQLDFSIHAIPIHAIEFVRSFHAEHPALVFSSLSADHINLLQSLELPACFVVQS